MESRVVGAKVGSFSVPRVRCFCRRNTSTRPSLNATPKRCISGTRSLRGLQKRRMPIPRAAGFTAERAALDITKMEPLGDRVLVKPLEKEEQTSGGLFLPSGATDVGREAAFGEVLAVGDDVHVKIAKGDNVMFTYMSSAKVEVADGEIVFVHDQSILAILS